MRKSECEKRFKVEAFIFMSHCLMAWGSKGFWSGWYFVATQWVRTYRKDLEFNNWIFCYLDFSEVGGCHNFLVVLSWVFGKSNGEIFSDWSEI